MTRTILIVAAHPDDEALGCGGTIARHVAEGDVVYAVFLADGVSSRVDQSEIDSIKRKVAAENAKEILGIKKNFYLGLPDNQLDSIPLLEVIRKLETILEIVKPNIIYTHHSNDLNIDHRITNQAVLTCSRPIPGSNVELIYTFEIMSSTEWQTSSREPFIPNHFVEIGNYLKIKESALNEYQQEMRDKPHSRNIEHLKYLAYHRGHTIGVEAAEAYCIARSINKIKI